MTHDPRTVLETGVTILDPVLTPHGFFFSFQDAGHSSGGYYAWGKYEHNDRSLHLHHRWGLGMISYHIGDLYIDHEAYLKFLGVEDQSDILWMPLDSGLDRYHALRSDLDRFCSDFVFGPRTIGNRPPPLRTSVVRSASVNLMQATSVIT